MKRFDVFNGDADGICALQQMRLAEPVESTLVTGVKRDIQLVKRVEAQAGDAVLVLDVSLAKNIEAVKSLLEIGSSVQYFDHHLTGDFNEHELLTMHINTSPNICTSLLVNQYLNDRYMLWAIVGAYGDNMTASADDLAEIKKLNTDEKLQLQKLGIYLNYNGYGASLDDLHFNPEDLFRAIQPYGNPFDFIHNESVFETLKLGYEEDMQKAECLEPIEMSNDFAVYKLPNEKWCRRVSGVLGNDLSNKFPERAHALLTVTGADTYQVSVRAPQINKVGAGLLCSQFETGGGREGAAGINKLSSAETERFISAFKQRYSVA